MAAEDKIDSFADIPSLKKEKETIVELLNEVYKQYQRINNTRITLEGDKSLTKVAESVRRLRTEDEELAKVSQQVEVAYRKRMALESEQAKLLAEEKLLTQQRNAELKNTVREENAAIGSLEQKRASLIRLQNAYDKLSESERKSGSGQELKTSIKNISNEILKLEGETGRFQRNVGNYSGAVNVLKKSFDEVGAKLDKFRNDGNASAQVVESLEKEYALLNQLLNAQGAGFANATAEIKANQKALLDMEQAGLAGSAAYRELAQATGDLKDQVGDLKSRTKALGSDTFAFDGMIQAAQGLAGVYGVAQGAAALFGDENKDLAKTFVKLQAIMTVMQGLQAAVNAVQSEGAAMLLLQEIRVKAITVATKIWTFVTAEATVATKALRVALISSGIGAILVLLPMAAEAMGFFSSKTDDAKDSVGDLNAELQTLNESFDAFDKQIERSTKLSVARAKAIGASETEVAKIEQEGIRKKIENLLLLKASLDKSYKDQSLNAEEVKKINEERVKTQEKINDLENELQLKAYNNQEAIRKKSLEDLKKDKEEREKLAKAAFELRQYELVQSANASKEIAENEKVYTGKRLEALKDYLEQSRAAIQNDTEFQLSNPKLLANERILIEKKAKDQLAKIGVEALAIQKTINEDRLKIFKEGIDALDKLRLESDQAELSRLDIDKNNALIALDKQFSAGLISRKKYEKERLAIQKDYAKASLQAELDAALNFLEIAKIKGEGVLEAEKKVAELREKISGDLGNTMETLAEKTKELGQEIANTLSAIIEGSFDRQKNQVQEEIDGLDKKKQAQIELVNATTDSEQLKADKIAIINARAQAQKEQLEAKQKRIEQQRAQFERNLSIARIIQSTAEAVVAALGAKPYTPANLALAADTGAIGAAELAAVLARPIPKFAIGTEYSPEGPAIVGEKGTEGRINPDGSFELTPSTASLTYLEKGTKIIPNNKLEDFVKQSILANATGEQYSNANDFEKHTKAMAAIYEKQSARIENAIKNQPTGGTTITEGGFRYGYKTAGGWVEYINDQIFN